ncbi:MAG: M28 family peptidase [Petrimonas sp.]|nr:M28 family peptidase [Petrimonas sp.]
MILRKNIPLLFFVMATFVCGAQNKVSKNIMEIGKTDNRTMQHLDVLTNRIGGRLIGSDAYDNATYWVADQLKKWGLEVEIQEVGEVPVGFNRGPWFGKMYGDEVLTLDFVTPSYTSGTKGLQRGPVVIEPKTQRDFDRMKGKLKGAWVLIEGKSKGWPIDISASADSLRASIIERNNAAKKDSDLILEPALFYDQMTAAGILGIIQAAPQPLVAIYDRKNLHSMTFDNLPTVPDIKLDEEQYNIIRKRVENREFVLLEFDIRNHFKPGPVKYHNVIGKIRGTKYPDEYVMSGCHLDSYDVASGAVDCGTGVAPNLEMARMIMTAGGNKPDRTILFCFWAGEEFGLLGSKYWVEHNKDKLPRISNYFNRDGGPTAASGLVVPENWYDDIKKCTEGLENYNPEIPFTVEKDTRGAREVPVQAGGSDHAYFAMNGVPVISFRNTDPLGYNFSYMEIWHTNRDRYDMSIPEYMEYTAVTQAVTLYNMANLKRLMPRDQVYLLSK